MTTIHIDTIGSNSLKGTIYNHFDGDLSRIKGAEINVQYNKVNADLDEITQEIAWLYTRGAAQVRTTRASAT